MLSLGSKAHVMALADQVVISGTSFVSTVLIGRWCLPSELGVYSMGISLLVGFISIQDPLVTVPYAVARHKQARGMPQEQAGDTLALCCLISALAFVLLGVAGIGLSMTGVMPGVVHMIAILAVVVPFALLREFSRQFAFAHLAMVQPLILDLSVAAVQMLGFGWLKWTGRLSATTACAVIGMACALGSAGWLYFARARFVVLRDRLLVTLRQNWRFGKWLFATQLAAALKGYLIYWLLALVGGMTATGVYAACMTIALIANPLVLALGNILTPRAALALAEGGKSKLWRESMWDTLLLGALMTVIYSAVLYGGEDVIRLVFPHQYYEGHGQTVAVLALALLASALGMPSASALTSLERPHAVFLTGFCGAVVTLVLTLCLVKEHGVLGAGCGVLAGSIVASLGRWAALFAVVARSSPNAILRAMNPASDREKVARVVEQLTKSTKDRDLVTEALGAGRQANIYTVRLLNRQPIWHAHSSLVIKLYKPAAGLSVEQVRLQFEALVRLHATLNDRTMNGWQTFVPAPLYVCKSPLALVMTMVHGEPLNEFFESNHVTHEVLDSLARAIVDAMDMSWSRGHAHGDLQLHNILCSVADTELAFLDAGHEPVGPGLDAASKRRHAATHDLAYLLYEASATVKSPIGKPCARLRQQRIAESILEAFVGMMGSIEDRHELLGEISARAWQYVEKHVQLSWSPIWPWRVVLRYIVSRRIETIVGTLRTSAGASNNRVTRHFSEEGEHRCKR